MGHAQVPRSVTKSSPENRANKLFVSKSKSHNSNKIQKTSEKKVPSGRSVPPSCALPPHPPTPPPSPSYLFPYPGARQEGGSERKGKGGGQSSLSLGPAPRRKGVKAGGRAPEGLEIPEWKEPSLVCPVGNCGHSVSCLSCHKGQEVTAQGEQHEWFGTESVLTVSHNLPRVPERQKKENHAFEELLKCAVNSEPSSLQIQCPQ